jgi:hypothetical protein
MPGMNPFTGKTVPPKDQVGFLKKRIQQLVFDLATVEALCLQHEAVINRINQEAERIKRDALRWRALLETDKDDFEKASRLAGISQRYGGQSMNKSFDEIIERKLASGWKPYDNCDNIELG